MKGVLFDFDGTLTQPGAKTVLLTNGGKSSMATGDPMPDYVCGDLNEVVEIVLVTVTSL